MTVQEAKTLAFRLSDNTLFAFESSQWLSDVMIGWKYAESTVYISNANQQRVLANQDTDSVNQDTRMLR